MSNSKDLEMLSLAEWSDDSNNVGTPTMVLLPPKNYHFKVHGKYKLTIPRKGTYYDIDPNFFAESDGEFNLLDDANSAMYLPAISKVLFATKQYPMLEDNELFAPIVLKFNKDSVDIYGQVVHMLELPKTVDQED